MNVPTPDNRFDFLSGLFGLGALALIAIILAWILWSQNRPPAEVGPTAENTLTVAPLATFTPAPISPTPDLSTSTIECCATETPALVDTITPEDSSTPQPTQAVATALPTETPLDTLTPCQVGCDTPTPEPVSVADTETPQPIPTLNPTPTFEPTVTPNLWPTSTPIPPTELPFSTSYPMTINARATIWVQTATSQAATETAQPGYFATSFIETQIFVGPSVTAFYLTAYPWWFYTATPGSTETPTLVNTPPPVTEVTLFLTGTSLSIIPTETPVVIPVETLTPTPTPIPLSVSLAMNWVR